MEKSVTRSHSEKEPSSPTNSEPGHVLQIKDLTVSYRRVPAVHHVSLELHCGRCVGLLGPNGAGKTSLLKAMGRYPALGWWKPFGEKDRIAVDEALRAMKLSELADRQISALSGGQQQRVFLARSLAQNAHVFLLDEPFAGLDKPSQDLLAEILRDLAHAGNLVIVSHHDLRMVPDLFDEVIFLNGELVACGPTAVVFNDENRARTFGTETFSGQPA